MKGSIVYFFTLLCLVISLNSGGQQGTLLVANKNESSISMIDLAANKVVATLPTGTGPHEVAVSFNGQTAVVCNYGHQQPNNSLSVLDLKGKSVVKTIDLGKYLRPHGIEFINDKEVIVTSEATQTLIRVNIESGSVEEVVVTGQKASHMVAYCRKDGRAYVANIQSGTVSQIDVAAKKLLNNIPFSPGIEGLDISPDGKELWVANRDDGTVSVVNTTTLKTIAVLQAGEIAYRVKFLPDGSHVMVSNAAGVSVSVFDVKAKKLIKTIAVDGILPASDIVTNSPVVPGGIATHSGSKYFYVSIAGYNVAAIIDTKTWDLVKTIKVGNGPDGMYYSDFSY